MPVINAIKIHVADTGFCGTLDKVKFDLSSFFARKMNTIPFFSTEMPKFPVQMIKTQPLDKMIFFFFLDPRK